MNALTAGVVRESAAGERRVALTPDGVKRLRQLGIDVLVQAGAGDLAWFDDGEYQQAGAEIVTPAELYARATMILSVGRPPATALNRLRPGQVVIGMLQPLVDPAFAARLAAAGVTAISLDGLPRTLSRAQPMDALSSQANVAGYKAVLVAADAFDRFFPLLITSAGTAKPARVLVLGVGVAGLQAIGTARRLGAVVKAFDVRPATRAEAESLGAVFLSLRSVADAVGEGGYARALTDDEQQALQDELAEHIGRHDVVITTAQVPGRRPPLLVTARAVKGMAPGSVIVDMAASDLGGNVEVSRPDARFVTDNGVTVIGAGNLPAAIPTAASAAYSRNISALIQHLVRDGELRIDLTDEIAAGVVITHRSNVVQAATARLVQSLAGARS
jgi:NAD(P) transhydrogenase subunit alpha